MRDLRQADPAAVKTEKTIMLTLGLLLFFEVLGSSFLYSEFSGYVMFSRICMLLLRAVLGAAVLVQMILDRADWKQWLFLAGFLVLSGLTVLSMKAFKFFDALFLALFYGRHLQYDRIISVFVRTIGAGAALVAVLSFFLDHRPPFIGRGGRQRLPFGFSHPNMLGTVMLLLAMLLLLQQGRKLRQRYVLAVFLMGVFTYILPNSLTSAMLLFLLALIAEISLLLQKTGKVPKKPMSEWRCCRAVCLSAMPLMFVAMFVIMLLTRNEKISGFLYRISSTFWARFILGDGWYQQYGFTLFGPSLSLSMTPAFITDSMYFCWPLAAGLVPTGFFIWVYDRCMKKAFDHNDYLLVVSLLLMMLHGTMEYVFISLLPSFLFLLPFCRQEEEHFQLKQEMSYTK